MEAANKFLKEQFLPNFNRILEGVQLDKILQVIG